MVTWIVVAVVVVGLVVLGLAVRPVLGRLSGLHRAATRLVDRQQQAMALQAQLEALNTRVAAVQEGMLRAQEQREIVKAARGGKDDEVASFIP